MLKRSAPKWTNDKLGHPNKGNNGPCLHQKDVLPTDMVCQPVKRQANRAVLCVGSGEINTEHITSGSNKKLMK